MSRTYRITPLASRDIDDIEVLRVVSGYQDLTALFEDSP